MEGRKGEEEVGINAGMAGRRRNHRRHRRKHRQNRRKPLELPPEATAGVISAV